MHIKAHVEETQCVLCPGERPRTCLVVDAGQLKGALCQKHLFLVARNTLTKSEPKNDTPLFADHR